MTRLVYYGNDILRRVADEVKNINQETIGLIKAMYKVMYKNNGVGLAAPQVNESKKIITIDIKGFKGPKLALINPEVVWKSDKMSPYDCAVLISALARYRLSISVSASCV